MCEHARVTGNQKPRLSGACEYYKNRITAVKPVPLETPKNSGYSAEWLLSTVHEHMHVDEDYSIMIVPVTIIANRIPADTEVVIIVAPSGSLKTEMIRAAGTDENQYIYPVSSITQ
jgi:hypothetical protein